MTNTQKVNEFVSNLFQQVGKDELKNTLEDRLAAEFPFQTKVEWSPTPNPTIYVMEESEGNDVKMGVLTTIL